MYLRSKSYYAFTTQNGSARHVAFFDASNPFAVVNIRNNLLQLESREVPMNMLRLLSNELIGQNTCVRWVPLTQISPLWEWSEANGNIITLTC